MEERKDLPEHLCSCACMPKAIFCLYSTAMFMGNLGLCNSAGITSQLFSSSGGEKCISVSHPEQELVTRLSASIMSSLFIMLKDYLFIKYFLLVSTSDICAFKCNA